jgi:hypothetical protein
VKPPDGMPATPDEFWHVSAVSSVGAVHHRRLAENQDAIGWLPESQRGRIAAVFAGDGHGSNRSFRSARGSNMAVQTARSLCRDLLLRDGEPADLPMIEAELEARAGRQLVRMWRELVDQDLKQNGAFTSTELSLLSEEGGMGAVNQVLSNPELAYGSTVLTALVTDTFLACWQLGDGDVVIVDAAGEAWRPIRPDPALLGNVTTSLSSPQAWEFFRWAIVRFPDAPPPLVLVATDGLANSYSSDAGFLQFGTDILRYLISDGIQAVVGKLRDNWLPRISQGGSGDDISVGLICHAPTIGGLRRHGGI